MTSFFRAIGEARDRWPSTSETAAQTCPKIAGSTGIGDLWSQGNDERRSRRGGSHNSIDGDRLVVNEADWTPGSYFSSHRRAVRLTTAHADVSGPETAKIRKCQDHHGICYAGIGLAD
ncbi:MAG: hypothetical protein ACYSTZ_06490 [Planctomycetota bacterium]